MSNIRPTAQSLAYFNAIRACTIKINFKLKHYFKKRESFVDDLTVIKALFILARLMTTTPQFGPKWSDAVSLLFLFFVNLIIEISH